MKTVALISEFNPFHGGHAYLLSRIRETYGDDTCILALMSGNYTQRGEPAIADKYTRAKAAVECGVNLVLEIPFPYAMSSAEFYANAGVSLAEAAEADVLAFGSECGELATLMLVGERIASAEFEEYLRALRADRTQAAMGHAALYEAAYRTLYGEEELSLLREPNNLLALRYLAALSRCRREITPFTVCRTDRYHDSDPVAGTSATALRAALHGEEPESAFSRMPAGAARAFREAMQAGLMPASPARLGPPLLAALRHKPPRGDSLSHRIRRAAMQAKDLGEVYSLVATKRYTNAHIRRAVFYHFFGVTSAELREPPRVAPVLGMDEIGRKKMAALRKSTRLFLPVKPADVTSLPAKARAQALRSQEADLLYPLAMPSPVAGNYFLLRAPYLKK